MLACFPLFRRSLADGPIPLFVCCNGCTCCSRQVEDDARSQAAEDVLLFSTSMRAAPAPPVIGSWALDEDDDFVDDVADDAFLFSTFER